YRLFSTDKESGIQITKVENSDLTYEKKHELNLGLDLGFCNNRINTVFDIFWRNNYDLIGPAATEGTGGQIIEYGNFAAMKSRGQELSIQTENIKHKNFGWTSNFIYSHVTTTVTKLDGDVATMDLLAGNGGSGFTKEGYPSRAIFSIPYVGLDENGIPQFRNEKGQITSTDLDFQSRNNSYLIYEGPSDPTITGSLGNELRWKNWRLNIFVTYSFGNVVRLDPVYSAVYNDLTSMTKDFMNRWMQPGDEKKTDIPGILSYRQYQNDTQLALGYNAYNYTHNRIAKGDFIRMKDISLVYDFPKKWFASTSINHISLKLQATNLFLIYADKKLNGQDPEFINAGGVASPLSKQYTLTLKFGL
ncbi:MAG TPA: SusC/RagA family protein, partial [Prevotella sp.]|nr:SusC/RagA family protein [Prevotella sp.]